MAEVIRKDAAVDDIVRDARQTLLNAAARGGQWQTFAEEKLAHTVHLFETVESRLVTATREAAPLIAVVHAANTHADKFLGEVSDRVWNKVGRPAYDPALSILFPGGIAYYAQGETAEQPERMELLAELLDAGMHPKLDPEFGRAVAGEVRREADTLRTAVTAAKAPRARITHLQQVRIAVARNTQIELANLKRRYKAEGFTDAEIHTVIPHHTRPHASKPEAPETPPTPVSA